MLMYLDDQDYTFIIQNDLSHSRRGEIGFELIGRRFLSHSFKLCYWIFIYHTMSNACMGYSCGFLEVQ